MIIYPDNEVLQYSGRIDFEDKKRPVFVYAGSYVKVKFTGNKCVAKISNKRSWAISSVGVIIDGKQGKIILPEDDGVYEYDLMREALSINVDSTDGTLALENPMAGLSDGEHELTLFKRLDGGQHYYTFYGFEFDDDAQILAPAPLPVRKIEVIGDSVSCGEVSEAVHCVAQSDPEDADGFYSNSWHSYGWQVARAFNAEIHITSQGGIALLDGTGYFNGEKDLRGVLSSYEKLEYNPPLGEKPWDCSKWKPDLIITAFGQNDANPVNFMENDYDGEAAKNWKAQYKGFLEKLQKLYPGVSIICITTVLMHNPNWDKAIDEVVNSMNDEKVHHFMFKRNGAATPGHPRLPEHNEMAAELTEYIKSIEKTIWG